MLLASILPTTRATFTGPLGGGDPLDDRWYLPLAWAGGATFSPETQMRCGTVLAAVRWRADRLGVCQPSVYQSLGGKDGSRDWPRHPVQRLLRYPNTFQTGMRQRQWTSVCTSTWGNAYSEIIGSPDNWRKQLWPLEPSSCRIVDQNRVTGSLVYEGRRVDLSELGRTQPLKIYRQDQVLHVRGFSTDGVSGQRMYRLIQNIVDVALAAEGHILTHLRNGAHLGGVLSHPETFGEGGEEKLQNSLEAFRGPGANGKFLILQEGMEFARVTATNQESQTLELNDSWVGAVLRALGVPGVAVGWMGDKTATYASAVEFMKSGVRDVLLPEATNLEAEEALALFLDSEIENGFYVRHNLDALARGDLESRTRSIVMAVGGPYKTPNEGRGIDDLNPINEPWMNTVARASNMTGAQIEADGPSDQPSQVPPGKKPGRAEASAPRLADMQAFYARRAPALDPDDEAAHAIALERAQFATNAAAAVARKEINWARRGTNGGGGALSRFAGNPEGLARQAAEFYGRHVAIVAQAMLLDESTAMAYCDRRRTALLEHGAEALNEDAMITELCALKLGD